MEPADDDHLLFGEINAAEQAQLGREVLELNHEPVSYTHLTLPTSDLV